MKNESRRTQACQYRDEHGVPSAYTTTVEDRQKQALLYTADGKAHTIGRQRIGFQPDK